MSIARKWAIVAAVSTVGFFCRATSAAGQIAWVADNGEMHKVDVTPAHPGILDFVAGANAYKIAIEPGGQRAWIVDDHEMLQRVDLMPAGQEHVRQIVLPRWRGAGTIALTPDGTRAYLPVGGTITPIDLVTVGPKWDLPPIVTIPSPWDVVISRDGTTAYVTSSTTNQVVSIDLATNTVGPAFQVTNPRAIAITPDGRTLFVAHAGTPATVTPISLPVGNVSPAITLIDSHQGVIAGQMVVGPPGQTLYIAGDTTLLRIDAQTGTEEDAIPLNLHQPATIGAIAISPDGKTVYVGTRSPDAGANAVIVPISIKTNKLGAPIPGFTNVTSIAFAPPAYNGYDNRVYFLGDSVTAGFGYCGQSENDLPGFRCDVNTAFPNSWKSLISLSLAYCAPPDSPDDRCSNNSYNPLPWNAPEAGKWVAGPNAPAIAYSYEIAIDEGGAGPNFPPAEIRNWAITGSTPANWDPGGTSLNGTRQPRGIFADQLDTIRNSYVVLTLGANPLLDAYLNIIPLPGTGSTWLAREGPCATSVQLPDGTAAPLTTTPGGVGACMLQQWGLNQQEAHLYNIFEKLLLNGNRVIVAGYPHVCPWSFGIWQPYANHFGGPAQGTACNSMTFTPGGISQQDQAFFLGDTANALISAVVGQIPDANIIFVQQSAEWQNHQALSNAPWVFLNDTWVHPSDAGHRALATAVEAAMCNTWAHWCKVGAGADVRW